jgi:hypothetical protein
MGVNVMAFNYQTAALIQNTELTVEWNEAEGFAVMRVLWKDRSYFATFILGSAEYLDAIKPILWAYVDGHLLSISVQHGGSVVCRRQYNHPQSASDWYIEIIDNGMYLCDGCSTYGVITINHCTMDSLRRQLGKCVDSANMSIKVVKNNVSDGR